MRQDTQDSDSKNKEPEGRIKKIEKIEREGTVSDNICFMRTKRTFPRIIASDSTSDGPSRTI